MNSIEKVIQDTESLPNLPTGTHRQHYSEQCEIVNIDDSPISLVREQSDWFVVMGKARLSKNFNTIEEALADAKRTDMARIVAVISAVFLIEREGEQIQQLLKEETKKD